MILLQTISSTRKAHRPCTFAINILHMKTLSTLFAIACIIFNAHASTPATPCDTIVTLEGKTYLCHIISQNASELHFSWCDTPGDKVYTISRDRVLRFSFAKIEKPVYVPAPKVPKIKPPKIPKPPISQPSKKEAPPKPSLEEVDEMAIDAMWQGIWSFALLFTFVMLPLAFALSLVCLSRIEEIKALAVGHPNRKKILRRLRWAKVFGTL